LRRRLWALIAIALVIPLASPAQAQTSSRSFYDSQGRFSGSVITTPRGDSSSSYDARGHFQGSAIKRPDGSTTFYDRNGRYLGSERKR
jgi:hypothetical protein